MRRLPEPLEKESLAICELYFSQFSEEEMKEDFDEEDFNRFFDSHASIELKLFFEFWSHYGDEGQLVDKNGEDLLDKDGHWIQNYHAGSDGYLYRDETGELICYSDGDPVPAFHPDQRIEKYFHYDDE